MFEISPAWKAIKVVKAIPRNRRDLLEFHALAEFLNAFVLAKFKLLEEENYVVLCSQ